MKTIKLYFLITLTIMLTSCDYGIVREKELQKVCEEAYFEGQKDVLNGDIRIKLDKDSCYYWIKSPWNNKKMPMYNPTYLESKK